MTLLTTNGTLLENIRCISPMRTYILLIFENNDTKHINLEEISSIYNG